MAETTTPNRRTVTLMADKYDVMKGLQCTNCDECPYQTVNKCTANVRKDALELIISQQAEIERLKRQSK